MDINLVKKININLKKNKLRLMKLNGGTNYKENINKEENKFEINYNNNNKSLDDIVNKLDILLNNIKDTLIQKIPNEELNKENIELTNELINILKT